MPASIYRYPAFRTTHMLTDLRFGNDAVRPGDHVAPVSVETLDGGRIEVGSPRPRPMLLVTGSLTCPMTESSTPGIVELHTRYGEAVDFVFLSGREAHPGERLPQPASTDEARLRARLLADHHQVPFTVAVDDLDGSLHRQLGGKPNTAVLLDKHGTVVFRSIWASDRQALTAALDAISAGARPSRTQSTAMLGPIRRAMPLVTAVVARGGRQATRDLRRSAPPMAAMAWMTRGIRRSHPARQPAASE